MFPTGEDVILVVAGWLTGDFVIIETVVYCLA